MIGVLRSILISRAGLRPLLVIIGVGRPLRPFRRVLLYFLQQPIGDSIAALQTLAAILILMVQGSYSTIFKCSSRRWRGSSSDGASNITSLALAVLGKAITSRILGSSAISITRRSMPGAMPP